jgi:hypothetical protein
MIEAAIQLVYENTPSNGSGGFFSELKLPSILGSLVQHNGFQIHNEHEKILNIFSEKNAK